MIFIDYISVSESVSCLATIKFDDERGRFGTVVMYAEVHLFLIVFSLAVPLYNVRDNFFIFLVSCSKCILVTYYNVVLLCSLLCFFFHELFQCSVHCIVNVSVGIEVINQSLSNSF